MKLIVVNFKKRAKGKNSAFWPIIRAVVHALFSKKALKVIIDIGDIAFALFWIIALIWLVRNKIL